MPTWVSRVQIPSPALTSSRCKFSTCGGKTIVGAAKPQVPGSVFYGRLQPMGFRMSRQQARTGIPSYCHHRASGQAVVRLSGKDFYLGPWNTPQSRAEYDWVVNEWLARGRRLPERANPPSRLSKKSSLDTTPVFARRYLRSKSRRSRPPSDRFGRCTETHRRPASARSRSKPSARN